MPAAPPSADQLAVLALLWALWACPHSLLLQEGLRARLQAALGLRPAVYRLLYSLFSIISILPVLMYLHILGGVRPYFWPVPWLALQAALVLAALGIFGWASGSFSRGGVDLFGWRQAMSAREPEPRLVEAGVYAHLRHPMHLAGVILLWARGLGPADLATSLLLTLYIVLGTRHEERRLRRQFGQAYVDYAARVPVIPGLPW